MKANPSGTPTIAAFLEGKSPHTVALYHHFVDKFQQRAPVTLHPAKTMIGVSNGKRRVVYITALGKNFLHAIFMFSQPYRDNLCFIKIAQVPDEEQYNHHFRMYAPEDVNEEVQHYMKLALEG
jgi:hypothetical protein